MSNYAIFIKELYERGVISKETYEKAKNKEKKKWLF